jgi:ferric-dicitrate binding protein FerR (iron transport regulator)
MTGELDTFSRILGQQEATLAGLKDLFDRHCDDDDRRHNENINAQCRHGEELVRIRTAIEQLTKALAGQAKDIDGLRLTPHMSGRRTAAIGALAMGVVTLFVYFVETIVQWVWAWTQSHWH